MVKYIIGALALLVFGGFIVIASMPISIDQQPTTIEISRDKFVNQAE